MHKKYIAALVVVMIIVVLSFKLYDRNSLASSEDFAALHNKNIDYRSEIQKAKQNNQPLFIEFYGDF